MEPPPPRASPSSPAPEEPAWKRILAARSPREVLARLVDGDPLDLRARCESRVRGQAVLVDVQRLNLRTAAHVARHAASYAGTPPVDVWIAEKIRKAIHELLQEQAELVASGAVAEDPEDERMLAIADALSIDRGLILRGCVAFNRCSYEARSAFQGLVLEAQELSAWCTANSTTADRARAALKTALRALGAPALPDLDAWLSGGDDDA